MRDVIETARFRRDVKLAIRRRKDLTKLEEAVLLLIHDQPLAINLRDHALTGPWSDHRDLHIEPDWLLIYQIDGNDLHLVRTGTHSDLFGK